MGSTLEAAIWSHSHSSSEGLLRIGGADLSADQSQHIRTCTSSLVMVMPSALALYTSLI